MGGSRSQANKQHKSRFASKASRQVHKTSGAGNTRVGKQESHRVALKGARAARIQRSKMIRDQKRAALLKEKRASGGPASPPRVVVLFGLSQSVNLSVLARNLLALSSGEDKVPSSTTVASPVYKFKLMVLEAPHGDLLTCMEMAKVADLIGFVVSANSMYEGPELDSPIDAFGIQCLSVFRTIGLPSTAVFIQDLPTEMKKKQELKKMSISNLASEFPEECKFYSADTKEDLHKFMWLFKEQHLSAPHWRNQRAYLISHQVNIEADDDRPGICSLVLSGYVRAHRISVNQLVHVSGAGDFQLSKMEILKDPYPLNEKRDSNLMDSEDTHRFQVTQTLLPDPSRQEHLVVENTPDPLAGEQTWPTEAEIVEADANNRERKLVKKKLPRGTSEYQAAWIMEDTDEEDSDKSEDDDEAMSMDEQRERTEEGSNDSDIEGSNRFTENYDEETEGDINMADEDHLTKEQIEAEIKKIKEANADDQEFPDEVETPIDVPAKKRFAKYRGLKSFRTSSWDPKESLPPEYSRIFAFDNFRRTQKHVLAKVLDIDGEEMNEAAPIGSFIRLYVKNVPTDVASNICLASKTCPIVLSGLLLHESKMSVLHFSIKKHDSYDVPIKSKETFIFHVGFRHFLARPIFSSDNLNSDKHKMEKFLHPGRFSIASVYAPVCFPPLPLVALKIRQGEAPAVAAVGSLRSVDPDRIILKKIVLTGYPQRVSKLKAIVRYMFHSPDDVRWFKPVDVWTKCGRRGRIKEPVGTHGAMKCIFNTVMQQHDTVCMSLYKRAYPKWPEQMFFTHQNMH